MNRERPGILLPALEASLAAVLQPRIGGAATSNVFANAQGPLFGLAVGFAMVHPLVEPLGVWWALFVGLVGCLCWNLALWRWNHMRRASAAADVNPA